MKRKIDSFDLDPDGDWRAKLECGHYQHVRHDPPLVCREWVTSEIGRAAKIGQMLECKRCDEGKPADFGHEIVRSQP